MGKLKELTFIYPLTNLPIYQIPSAPSAVKAVLVLAQKDIYNRVDLGQGGVELRGVFASGFGQIGLAAA